MKFMITWKISPGAYKPAIEQFLATKAPPPAGLETVGRWHAPGSNYGWHLVQGDVAALAQHTAEWADVCELEMTPVIEDDAAATSLSKVHGK